MGMMDGLTMGQTDSATDLRVDSQTVSTGRWMDGMVARQTDVLKDGRVVG